MANISMISLVLIMQKAPVKNTEQVTKEMGQMTQKETPECKIKKMITLGLLLDCLHENVRVYFESCIKTRVKSILKWIF
jgi:hypothetical protein